MLDTQVNSRCQIRKHVLPSSGLRKHAAGGWIEFLLCWLIYVGNRPASLHSETYGWSVWQSGLWSILECISAVLSYCLFTSVQQPETCEFMQICFYTLSFHRLKQKAGLLVVYILSFRGWCWSLQSKNFQYRYISPYFMQNIDIDKGKGKCSQFLHVQKNHGLHGLCSRVRLVQVHH